MYYVYLKSNIRISSTVKATCYHLLTMQLNISNIPLLKNTTKSSLLLFASSRHQPSYANRSAIWPKNVPHNICQDLVSNPERAHSNGCQFCHICDQPIVTSTYLISELFWSLWCSNGLLCYKFSPSERLYAWFSPWHV